MRQIHALREPTLPAGQPVPSASTLNAQARAAELYALAKHLAHAPEDGNVAKWEEALGHLVGSYLAGARDDVLAEAMQLAQSAQDMATLDELGAQVAYEAEHQHLGLRPDGRPQEARLFAIPLIVPDVTQLGNGHLPHNSATDALVASLRVEGLVASTQGLTLVKYLYHPDELDALSPSAVFQLCRELALAVRDEVPCSSYEALAVENATAGLRYLVGVVTGPASDDSLLLSHDHPDSATVAEWADKIDHWCARADKCLVEALGLPPSQDPKRMHLEVYPVGGFSEARRLGEVLYKGTATLTTVLQVLRNTGIDPGQVHAIVAPYILDDTSVSVVVSLTSKLDGALLGTSSYPVSAFELLDDALDDVHCMLETRIGEVSVVDTLVAAEPCDCCGKPMFLTPAHPAGAHAGPPAEGLRATFH